MAKHYPNLPEDAAHLTTAHEIPSPGNKEHRGVIVIGGGLAGLTAAYDLARAGYQVTLIDADQQLGGLAKSFLVEGHAVEMFYHFICRLDAHLIQMITEIGLKDKLHWQATQTSFYHQGHLHPFGSPFDLLGFSPIPWMQRLRFGLHILRSRYRAQWRWLDQIPARPWLIESIGEEAYQVIWHPLLRIKFGESYDRISAAWVWHRIWRVARSRRSLVQGETFGYLEDGSSTLVNALAANLQQRPNVDIRLGEAVTAVEIKDNQVRAVSTTTGRLECQAVVSTIALPQLNQILPYLADNVFHNIRQVNYIGVVCAIFNLSRPFSRYFWMNINDPRISFNGIIEQTNLNHTWQAAGLNLVYVPYYLPVDQPRYSASDQALFDEYTTMLKYVNPAFETGWIKDYQVYRAPYAQAICTTGFAALVPPVRSPVSGLYITDSTQFYPEDRTLSAAIQQGHKAALAVVEDRS